MQKDKNVMARTGHSGYTDQEYIDTFNLDPEVDIDQQMYDISYNANVQDLMDKGNSRIKAEKIASGLLRAAKAHNK